MANTSSFIEDAITANRTNFILKAKAWAEADPLFSVVQLDGATAVFSGSSTDTFNILALAPGSTRPAFDIIEEARDSVFTNNRFAVWSWKDGQLQSLPVDKSAIDEHLIMTCEHDDLTAPSAAQEKLAITPANEPQHLMDIGAVLGSTFGGNEEAFMVQSVFAGQEQAAIEALKTKYFIAYDGGKPVACGSYIIEGSYAGVYDIAVLAERRKEGLGGQMFGAVLKAAAQDGAMTFTLHASPDGEGIYDRAGFQTIGFCWSLDIS